MASALSRSTQVCPLISFPAGSSGLRDGVEKKTVKPAPQRSFFANAAKILDRPYFTAYLDAEGKGGEYGFGSVDRSRFQGKLAWTPVDSGKGYWDVASERHAVDGKVIFTRGAKAIVGQLPHSSEGGEPALMERADTGTTLLLMETSAVEHYYSLVPGAALDPQSKGWIFPCGSWLPSLAVAVGSFDAVIPPNILRYSTEDGLRTWP